MTRIKYQIAMLTDMPHLYIVQAAGPIEPYEGAWITKTPIPTMEKAKTLAGTIQSRAERLGAKNFDAAIIPFGTKPPKTRRQYRARVVGPLKARLDYGMNPQHVYEAELRPTYNYYSAAKELEHPDTVIFPPSEWYPEGLTERAIHDYYDKVSDRIINQYVQNDLDGMVILYVDDRLVIKRNASIEVQAMKIGDQEAFGRLNGGRAVEFHFAMGDEVKFLWLDLDPKPDFPWEDAREIAAELAERLSENAQGVIDTEIRFSGRDGFHIYAKLDHTIPVDEARRRVAAITEDYITDKKDERLTASATKDPKMMRLDYSTLHKAGGLRCAYSLAFPTGLVCLPIPVNGMGTFEREEATIEQALGTLEVKSSYMTYAELQELGKGVDLEKYRQKRDPSKTPEPMGDGASAKRDIFVVQEHQAKKAGLHYDFRLEQDGALRSWAVPKLPELVEGDKKQVLAMQVEDHPVAYARFEGEIPEGQYGGGTVKIWDKGTYETEKTGSRSWNIRLKGSKLQGSYVLINTGGDKWLLQKGVE
jgi:DNA ligase D-like protein (predicted 3'-phosphoesterase)